LIEAGAVLVVAFGDRLREQDDAAAQAALS
jgi:hypothetical protein